jgi:hypothetical protein
MRFLIQPWILQTFFNCPPNVPGLTCPTEAQLTNASAAIRAGAFYPQS